MPRLFVLLAAAALIRPAVAQSVPSQCWGAEDATRSFSGTMSTTNGVILEQIGRRGEDRVVQKSFGDLRVCMIARGLDVQSNDPPSQWPSRADLVIFETRTPGAVRTLYVNRNRVSYTLNGAAQPPDADEREWRDDLLSLLDPTWDLAEMRGRISSLRGQISSIQGERSALQGQISALRGQVSSMTGEISSLRGRVSSMQGEISTIRGQESSLRGAISSEKGAISSLRGTSAEGARRIDVDDRIRRHEDNIERLERQLRQYDADARVREVERRIDAFDVESKVAAVQRRIDTFDVEGKVARIQRRIDALGVEERVKRIEDQIGVIDDPERSRDLEERRDEALARLKRTLGVRD